MSITVITAKTVCIDVRTLKPRDPQLEKRRLRGYPDLGFMPLTLRGLLPGTPRRGIASQEAIRALASLGRT
eukprot:7353812-Pyramimonas_sp.AAC.3